MNMEALVLDIMDSTCRRGKIPDVRAFDGSSDNEHRLCGWFAIITKAPKRTTGYDLIGQFVRAQSKGFEGPSLCTTKQVAHAEQGAISVQHSITRSISGRHSAPCVKGKSRCT